jgi:hypothetical protein
MAKRKVTKGQSRNCLRFWNTWVHLPFFVEFVLFNLSFSVQCLVDHCLSFCYFSFGHFIVCQLSFMAFDYLLIPFLKIVKQTKLRLYFSSLSKGFSSFSTSCGKNDADFSFCRKTLHRKWKIEQHELNKEGQMNSGVSEA